jgi:hypothetical protein
MYNTVQACQRDLDKADIGVTSRDVVAAKLLNAERKLDKYFDLLDNSPLYYAAVILHPGRKFEYFEDKWGAYDDGKWVKKVKKSFEKLFNEYADKAAAIAVNVEIEPPTTANDYINFDRLSDTFHARKRKKLTAALSDEYDRYTKRFDPRDENITDPLA